MNLASAISLIGKIHESEKTVRVAEAANQYVFSVNKLARKRDIAAAIEAVFEVKVTRVTTLNVKGKRKRNKFGVFTRPGWKKAYITLADGDSIDTGGNI